ncbi:hypothetical protein LEMLEM_LOCUS527 [Lemmus lemmus]
MECTEGTVWPYTCLCPHWPWRQCWPVPGLELCTQWYSLALVQTPWLGGSMMVSMGGRGRNSGVPRPCVS